MIKLLYALFLNFILCITSFNSYAQNIPDNLTGVHFRYDSNNNSFISTNPKRSNQKSVPVRTNHHNDNVQTGGSYIRYYFTEPYGVGYYSAESGNGLYSSVGWSLSNERISLFGNLNSTELWDFPTYAVLTDYTDISDTGGLISAGVGNYIYALNRAGGIPVLTFNVQSYNNGTAGFTQITSRGDFLVGSSVRTDSSAILGFNISSNVPAWRLTVQAELMAMKLSGNDSILIANTYSRFWIISMYSGQVIYSGLINPSSNDGSQSVQGISGDGSIIATINYDGFLTVYHRNGNTYNQLWQYQEPPGMFYNWMSSVDLTYDGSMIAAGTLDFIADSTFDGKIKLFKTTNGAVPVWSYSGCGDQVSAVSFSKNGKILSAATWGNRYIGGPNLFVFKTTHPDSTPVFMLNSPGSFFSTDVSNDGQTVIASGKAVHARINGHGGTFYNVFIDTSDAPFGIKNNNGNIPNSFQLYQNFPNPFNPSTTIDYQLPKAGYVKISVFDVLGQEVKALVNEYKQAGTYNVRFDTSELPSGVYFYKITSGDFTSTKKLTLIK